MNKYCLATIVNHEEITSGIWKMELAASEIAQTAGPGQFIMLYPPDKRNLIAGKGTKQFSQLQKNDRIRIMGPLGNGFTLPDQATKSIVVGGGLGIPPLLELSKRLGGNTEVLLGYQDIPFMAEDFHRLGINVHIASQSGNYGLHGTVCDLLEKFNPSAGQVFACGPRQMLKSVSAWAKEHSIPIQVSMEERMACGIGACLGCGVKIQKPGEPDWKYLRVCKDGPVFSGEEVVWDE